MTTLRAVWVLSLVALSGCALDVDDVAASSEELRGSCDLRCERPGRTVPVIFDTDMDFDDAAALAYLCQQHKAGHIDLRAVTITNNGAGMAGKAIRHARCILAECGLTDIPLADGSPMGENAAPPELLFAVDTVLSGAFAECTESTAPSEISAPELLLNTLRDVRGQAVLLTTGPLTNVATAFDLDDATHPRDRRGPPISKRIGAMYVMGGAVNVPGNLLGSGTEDFDNSQELNIWIDPAAAQQAFETLRPRGVQLVPLDATNDVPVTMDFVATLGADLQTAEADMVHRIVTQPITQMGIDLGAFYWWDPLAAVAAVGELCTVDFERDRIKVIQDGPQAGRTISSRDGVHMNVAFSADQARFEQLFLDGLNGR